MHSAEKVKEAMQRLRTAQEKDFPWNVKLALMAEIMLALCDNNIETSESVLKLIHTVGENNAYMRQRIEDICDDKR